MAKINDVKIENLRAVWKAFFSQDDITLKQLEEITGLSHGAAVNTIGILKEADAVFLSEKTGTTAGRKTHHYRLNPAYMQIGMISAMRLGSGLCFICSVTDLNGKIISCEKLNCESFDMNMVLSAADRILENSPQVKLLAVSVPGVCANGIIVSHHDEQTDLGSYINKKYGIAWVVENDVNTACIGFHHSFQEYSDLAFVYQPVWNVFGCGMIIHGSLYNGFAHAAGELRYFPFMRFIENRTGYGLLKEQILSVAALLNPQMIGYCSLVTEEDISIDAELPALLAPRVIRCFDFEKLQTDGLRAIAVKHIIHNTGGIL